MTDDWDVRDNNVNKTKLSRYRRREILILVVTGCRPCSDSRGQAAFAACAVCEGRQAGGWSVCVCSFHIALLSECSRRRAKLHKKHALHWNDQCSSSSSQSSFGAISTEAHLSEREQNKRKRGATFVAARIELQMAMLCSAAPAGQFGRRRAVCCQLKATSAVRWLQWAQALPCSFPFPSVALRDAELRVGSARPLNGWLGFTVRARSARCRTSLAAGECGRSPTPGQLPSLVWSGVRCMAFASPLSGAAAAAAARPQTTLTSAFVRKLFPLMGTEAASAQPAANK